MKRTSFETMQCPIARTLERVGEWWNILILRDAMMGMTRFEQFQSSLGISPNVLSARLKGLVANGFLEKRLYSESPPRMEYIRTKLGVEFDSVILMMAAFGNENFAVEGVASGIVHRETGIPADLAVVDRNSGLEVSWPEFVLAEGPAASDLMKAKLAWQNENLEATAPLSAQ